MNLKGVIFLFVVATMVTVVCSKPMPDLAHIDYAYDYPQEVLLTFDDMAQLQGGVKPFN